MRIKPRRKALPDLERKPIRNPAPRQNLRAGCPPNHPETEIAEPDTRRAGGDRASERRRAARNREAGSNAGQIL
jgi:hypothetical protein